MITREAIATYLDEQFSDLASLIGQNADPDVGYAPDINNAFRKLGTDEADLPTAEAEDTQRTLIFALAEYYAALRFWRQLTARVNLKVDDSTFDYREVLKSVQGLLADAASKCAALGQDVTAGGWGIVDLNLDWAEPDPDYA